MKAIQGTVVGDPTHRFSYLGKRKNVGNAIFADQHRVRKVCHITNSIRIGNSSSTMNCNRMRSWLNVGKERFILENMIC